MLTRASPTAGEIPRASLIAHIISLGLDPQRDEVVRDLRPDAVLARGVRGNPERDVETLEADLAELAREAWLLGVEVRLTGIFAGF